MNNEIEELKQWTWVARDLNGMLILSDGRLVKDTMLECWYQVAEEENESYKIVDTEFCSPFLDFVRWENSMAININDLVFPEEINKIKVEINETENFLIEVVTNKSGHQFVKHNTDFEEAIEYIQEQLSKDIIIVTSKQTDEAVIIPREKIEHVYIKKQIGVN